MTFASSFAAGLQLAEQQRLHADDDAIKKASDEVQAEIAKEKEAKRLQEEAQRKLFENAKPSQSAQEAPGVYQQGDSLGLQGYQTGNKPVQATVQTAPAGYMSRNENDYTNDLSPGGMEYPSANPATEQTLVGNYGTTAAFKGEKPTEADTLRMQKDTTDQFQTGPFTGKNEQVNNLTDLAANKPETTTQEVKPKPLDNLNDHITAAQMAKDSYEEQFRVVRKLEQNGNYKAALAYKDKLANSELTLANAEHTKFTTTAAIAKQVGNMAENVIELIKQPGADVNKLYYDFAERIKNEFGFTGKIPFSLDPNENIKTLDRFRKDAMTTLEKSELGIKDAIATRDSVYKQANLRISEAELNLKIRSENRAQQKEDREATQADINNMLEGIKLKQKIVDSLNSVQDKDLKKAYSDEINAGLTALKTYEKRFGVKAVFNNSTNVNTQNVNPAIATTTTNQGAQATTNTNPSNNRFSEDISVAVGAKPVSDTAGGYPRPASVTKTPAEQKADQAASKKTASEIEQNNARIKLLAEGLSPSTLARTSAERQKVSEDEIAKLVGARYDADWNKTKAFWRKVAGPGNEEALKEIEALKKRNKELENK